MEITKKSITCIIILYTGLYSDLSLDTSCLASMWGSPICYSVTCQYYPDATCSLVDCVTPEFIDDILGDVTDICDIGKNQKRGRGRSMYTDVASSKTPQTVTLSNLRTTQQNYYLNYREVAL